MGAGTPSVARVRALARMTCAYAVALALLLQGYALARGILEGLIIDPWLAAVPVLWFDVALIGLLLFLWGLSFGGPPAARSGARAWFALEFPAIRTVLRSAALRSWILGAAAAYAVLLMVLSGMIVVDPAGGAPSGPSGYPFFEVFDAPLGWGPRIVWAPNPYFFVIVRPFTTAITVLLSLLAGFGIGLLGYVRRSARASGVAGRGTAGAAAGLLVICPACAASPMFALFAGLLTPAAAGETTAAVSLALGPVLAFSTAMLLVSVVLLWRGVARTSRLLPDAKTAVGPLLPAAIPRRLKAGQWALVLALVLAVGALLVDLSVAPPPTAHDVGHGAQLPPAAAPGHPASATGLAVASVVFAALGVAMIVPRTPTLSKAYALVFGLTLLYAAGLVHWFAILEHLGAPLTAVFFLATGAAQIAVTPLAIRRQALLWWIGVAFTAFLIALYAASRFAPPPLGLESEPVESLDLWAIGAEGGALVALGLYFRGRMVSTRLTNTVVHGPPFAILLVATLAIDAIIGVEASWGLLPFTAFLLAALLLLALIVSAALAHVRRSWPAVGLTWALAVTLIGLNISQASYFASASLTVPVVLCLTSALLLGAPLLFPTGSRRIRVRGLVAG